MQIEDMVATISDTGILKPNKYAVKINIPSSMTGEGFTTTEATKQMLPRIERVTLPEVGLETIEDPSNTTESLPILKSHSQFEQLSLNIILSEDAREKTYMDEWVRNAYGYYDKYIMRYYDDYTGEIEVTLYSTMANDSKESKPIKKYTFYNAYPVSVGDIELAYSETDTYSTIAVSFNWNQWKEETV